MGRARVALARKEAQRVYAQHVGVPAPRTVDVKAVIRSEGIDLQLRELEFGTFGIFMRSGDRRRIVADHRQQGEQRLRFTLAHELGHACLHQGDGCLVDGYRARRDALSTTGTNRDEVEANAFAAELLMPEVVVRRLAEKAGRVEEDDVRRLAGRFGVSPMAMTVRLDSLGFFIW